MRTEQIEKYCKEVLERNRCGTWTVPSSEVYPHQWLWDSCFHVIGIANYDIVRACEELRAIFRGQWSNGMLPNMIIGKGFFDRRYWRSKLSPFAPKIPTSGITQPPLVAQALLKCVDVMLSAGEEGAAISLIKEILPKIICYHDWLYINRDPNSNGRLVLFHPWETGLDSAPYWVREMKNIRIPIWIRAVEKSGIINLLSYFRSDVKSIDSDQRMDNSILLRLHHVAHQLRACSYDARKFLSKKSFAIESVFFNSVAVRNNAIIEALAHVANVDILPSLLDKFRKAESALNDFYDTSDGRFKNINYHTEERIEVGSIEEILPIYSGLLTPTQIENVLSRLEDKSKYFTKFPIPSVPIDSEDFQEIRYWQGPSWVNTNWLIANGLKQHGYNEKSYGLENLTCEMVENGLYGNKHSNILGSYSEKEQTITGNVAEYYSALDGKCLGAKDFSWTAALTIDMLSRIG